MKLPAQIAKHFKELHFGGNWTCVNLKEELKDVSWQQATAQVGQINTIATLVYHTHYYVASVLKVLQGEPLNSKDEYSFITPQIQTQENWEALLAAVWAAAEQFATMVEALPEERLWENFTDAKYGNYYRNIHGIIEHTHYHLGQIVILKKLLAA